MQPDLNPLADTTDAPKKKWFEGEQKCDLFFQCTVVQARNRLLHAVHCKVPEKTGFRNTRSEWEIKFDNDYFQIKITIYEGRGRSNYHCFGKLLGSTNGTLVQIVVRDTSTSNYIGLAFPFFGGVWITRNLTIIIVLFFFFGFIGLLGAIIERKASLNKAIKVITTIISA